MNFGFCFNNIVNIRKFRKQSAKENAKKMIKMFEELDLHKIPYVIMSNTLNISESGCRTYEYI